MDIEKMIEQLRYLADTPSYTAFHNVKEREIICDQCEADFCHDKLQDAHWCMYEALSRAATTLSTLQIENQALRNAANGFKAESEKLRAELEKVNRERDAAVKDLNEFLSMDELCPIQCEWCKWNGTYCDGKKPEWRGIKED